jgi:hypothetical protein
MLASSVAAAPRYGKKATGVSARKAIASVPLARSRVQVRNDERKHLPHTRDPPARIRINGDDGAVSPARATPFARNVSNTSLHGTARRVEPDATFPFGDAHTVHARNPRHCRRHHRALTFGGLEALSRHPHTVSTALSAPRS